MKLATPEQKAAKGTRPVEYKSLAFKVDQVDAVTRKVSGYLAAFGNIDSVDDVLLKGCFLKSIQEHGPLSTSPQKIAYLWMHDMKEPVGRFTLLEERDFGLYFEAEVDPIPLGDRLLAQYASGTLNQHSIGFRYIWEKCGWGEWINEAGEKVEAFICTEIKLMEGSVVSIGANENTPFEGFKSSELGTAQRTLDIETERLLSKFSPSEQYEFRQIITKHIALSEARFEPGRPLKETREPLKKGLSYAELANHLFNN